MNEFESKEVSDSVLDEETRGIIGKKLGFYSSNKWYIWAIIVALGIIGVLVYLVFFKAPKTTTVPAKVGLFIEVPEQIPAGGEVVYKVRVENQDTKTLAAGQLEVVFPDGATYLQSTPPAQNSTGTLYGVPELVSSQNAVLFVKVKLLGGVGDTKTFTAKYHYRFSGVSSEFEKTATASSQLNASDVGIEWDGPVSTNNAQLAIYTLHYRNSSNKDIGGARISVTYPEGFSLASSIPPADVSGNVWSLGKLAAGGEGKITIQGTYSGSTGGEIKNMKADFSVLGNSGAYFTQGSSSFATTISSVPLLVQIVSDGGGVSVLKPGDRPTFQVNYVNNSTLPASSVNVSVTIDSKAVDSGSLSSDGGIVAGNTITWNASSNTTLENVVPNGKGSFRFSFAIKNPPVKDNSKNLEIKISSKITAQEYTSPFPGSALNIKIATVGTFSSGVQHVSGPIPPKVGATTSYAISLKLKNTTNDITDGIVTAFLPLDPGSFDKASIAPKDSASVVFDPATSKLTWKVGNIPSGSGSFIPERVLTFRVNLTPVASQNGKPVTLLKTLTFSGLDAFTGQQINLTADSLSTQDDGDGTGGIVGG